MLLRAGFHFTLFDLTWFTVKWIIIYQVSPNTSPALATKYLVLVPQSHLLGLSIHPFLPGMSVVGGLISPVHDQYSRQKDTLIPAKHRIKMIRLTLGEQVVTSSGVGRLGSFFNLYVSQGNAGFHCSLVNFAVTVVKTSFRFNDWKSPNFSGG